ncbi:MAG: hypothetical protein BWX47_01638 [candidate division Hyd24-12 bacterium ADurb.Bin004]|nr:MAG: hypothetical protein BWX47_01638 [candidate division Hyd24-12 bacterium ADurb.Bin004]
MFWTDFWITLFRGLAPYTGSNPLSARRSRAFSSASTLMPDCSRSLFRRASWIETILRRSTTSRGRKTITSSIRLRNSGLNCASRSRRARAAMSVAGIDPAEAAIHSLPTLLVMMSRQLRKSTVLPCPSVRRPSSSTCSRMLKTSG